MGQFESTLPFRAKYPVDVLNSRIFDSRLRYEIPCSSCLTGSFPGLIKPLSEPGATGDVCPATGRQLGTMADRAINSPRDQFPQLIKFYWHQRIEGSELRLINRFLGFKEPW